VFHVSIWGVGACFWGAKPTEAPRGDGTGELRWEKRIYIGRTSYGQLRVLRQYFAAVQNLSSCCLPSAYGIED